ncbi:uncharacterized protein JCM6883_004879 [Sporobolomyces salmoneus]|uniref:uncharacterized protein n=1 Tax=Sporobolomyces salmoneus TaxID=183962 RepID=UPI00317BB79A
MVGNSWALEEARQAVSEVESWGIEAAEIIDEWEPTSNTVMVSVLTLEGAEYDADCTESGWKLLGEVSDDIQIYADINGGKFESLEHLLFAVSPEFARRRTERLDGETGRIRCDQRSTR